MGRKVRFTRSKNQVSRESLQKIFAELQQLKEQIRLAEIAARQSSAREEDSVAKRPHTLN